jgi:gliding motility-associated-like protein
LWQDGKNERFHTALDQGLYWVEVKDFKGCRARDSVFIAKDPNLYSSMVFMPSAFTPDGNGINDWYPNNQFVAIGSLYEVKLYNRWGEKIAEYFSPNSNWDGTINGNPAPEGVYVYLATWIGCDNIRRSLRGDFHVLR